jgi:hypothetical protein
MGSVISNTSDRVIEAIEQIVGDVCRTRTAVCMLHRKAARNQRGELDCSSGTAMAGHCQEPTKYRTVQAKLTMRPTITEMPIIVDIKPEKGAAWMP